MLRTRSFLAVACLAVLLPGCEGSSPLLDPSVADVDGIAAAKVSQTIPAPSTTTATATSSTQIIVSWQDNATNETSVEIHRSVAGASYVLLATLVRDAVGYTDEGLTAATQYCYRVVAARVTGTKTTYSAPSDTACATTAAIVPPPPPPPTPPPTAPAAASEVSAYPMITGGVTVRWLDNATNEDGYRIERSSDGGAFWSVAGSAPASGGNYNFFGDGGRPSEQQVCYRVIAFNAGGDAAPSNTACTTPPAAPTNLTVTQVDAGTLLFTWSDNSATEDGYQLWGRFAHGDCCPGWDSGGGDGCSSGYYEGEEPILDVPAGSTSARFTGTGCGILGYPYNSFFVVAKKDGGVSSPSADVVLP
jgi:hypothetical protein